MKKRILFSIFLLLFSCNKEKHNNRLLAGDWEIRNYSEIIFDGTTNKFSLLSGSAHFDNLNGKAEANFSLTLYAVASSDTIDRNVSGVYSRRAIDTLELKMNDSIYLFDINRIFKTDLNLQGGLDPNRKGIYIMKKK
jgi:hypothetical protein